LLPATIFEQGDDIGDEGLQHVAARAWMSGRACSARWRWRMWKSPPSPSAGLPDTLIRRIVGILVIAIGARCLWSGLS
jgi:hypothetical protein